MNELGVIEVEDSWKLKYRDILVEANNATQPSRGMVAMTNYFQNELLGLLVKGEQMEDVQNVIEQYTKHRINECLLRPDFAAAMKSPNASFFVKALKAKVVDELGLNEGASKKELTLDFIKKGENNSVQVDVSERYNVNDIM